MHQEHLTVKELPETERPYEKCEQFGAKSLTNAELIAVIIRTGSAKERSIDVANRVLGHSTQTPGLLGLNYMTMQELMEINGIGKVKAIQLLCVAELTKRMAKASKEEGIRLTNPSAVADFYMQDMRHLLTEEVKLVMMDSKSKILKDMTISSGTVNASLLVPREIFINALKYNAVNIILVHNHPSGDPSPSKEDINTTKRINEAANLIGIKLMDHIIIGDNKYVSLKEIGLL